VTVRREAPGRSPLALRLIHAAVFLAFAAGAMAAALPEWRHGVFALGRPFHTGSPPRALLILGSVLAATGAAGLLLALARGRSAPQGNSWLILGGAVAAVLGTAGSSPPERPSELSANTALIHLGQSLQRAMVDRLQQHGEVPVAIEPWQEALSRMPPSFHPFRTRTFQQVTSQVWRVATPESRPESLLPGSLLLFVSPDGASFELRLVGLTDGHPQVLVDHTGIPVTLRGLYNPDLPGRTLP
jgi:hypothetical protein